MNTCTIKDVPLEVKFLFRDRAFKVWEMGFDKYSAQAIIENIRWHQHVEQGNREFKINNNWTPVLSRWLMKRYPDMDGFFELRESAIDEDK